MRFRNLRKWSNPENCAGLLFFAQRMEELLFDYTLDSYKPLALNPPSLCNEALLLISDIEQGVIDQNNIAHVLLELEWSIQNDKVAKSLLDAKLNRYVLTSEDTLLKDKKILLEVLSRTLDPYRYLSRCNELLEDAVQKVSKKEINILARTLVTTLINMNISKHHLYNETLNFFYTDSGSTITSNSNIHDYLDKIFPRGHDFNVFFICSNLLSKVAESVVPFRIKILNKIPDDLLVIAKEKKFIKGKKELYIEIEKIRCGDVYTAREMAERRLNDLRDLFTLFSHKQQIHWKEETLIKQCCLDDPIIVNSPKHSMEKGFDMKPVTASRQLNLLLKNISLKDGSFEKFKRAVDFHGIGIATDIPENQIISIWIAMETLVPALSDISKIKKIIDSILPFILFNYVRRLVEKYTADLYKWNRHKISKILKKLQNTTGLKSYEKVLLLLAHKENDPLLIELYKSFGDFHLLRFRTFQLSSILRKPKKIKTLLEEHEKKVSWQIRRIYRTRNIIVHTGRSPNHINALIENGHDYLDQIMFEIIKMTTGEYQVETFEQAFELVKLKYEALVKKLKSDDELDDESIDLLLLEHWGAMNL